MKTYKKLGLGFLSAIFLFLILFGVTALQDRVSAASNGFTPAQLAASKYRFQISVDTIVATMDGKNYTFNLRGGASGSTTPATEQKQTYAFQGSLSIFPEFCGSAPIIVVNKSEFSKNPSDGGIFLQYRSTLPANSGQCTAFGSASTPIPISIDNSFFSTNPANSTFGGSVTTEQLDNASYKFDPNNPDIINATINGKSISFKDSNLLGDPANYKPQSGPFCDGTQYGKNGFGDSIKGITIKGGLNNIDQAGSVTIVLDYIDSSGDCQPYQASLTFAKQADGTYTATVTPLSDTAEDTPPSCETNFSFGFEWIMCPFLHLMDDIAGAFTQFISGQLCFNSGPSSTGGVSCPDQNNLTDQVKKTWGIFRIIASAALVIIMLVMVISQAIGGVLFDAYTIRKLLPKLVIAVILIQLSWEILKWGIDLSNDLGKGIADLMFAPFGGQSNTDLAKLVGHQVKDAAGGEAGADAFSVFALLAGATAFYISLPGLALLALYAVAALFTGFVVLVFRKLLIILLVILAPIAFVCWILPGTENYWKLWKDNFIKLLAMFPLIMAMIAGGRIFAYIAAGSPGSSASTNFLPHLAVAHIGSLPVPYFASVTDFATLAIIIVAFFGPFFLLPKAFSWGGGLMGSIGKGAESFMKRVAKKPAEVLQERSKGWRGERTRKSQERVARGEGFNWKAPWRYPVDKTKSGQWDPTQGIGRVSIRGKQRYAGSRRREQAISQYVARGTESAEAEVKAADAKFKPAFEEAEDHDKLARDIAFGGDSDTGVRGEVTYVTKSGETRKLGHVSLADRQAGLNATLRYGGGRNIRFLDSQLDELNNGTREGRVMAEKFRDANAQTLLSKMKHVYFASADAPGQTRQEARDQAFDRTIDNGISESSIAAMDTVEMEGMLESLSHRAAAGDAAAAGRLSTVLTTYQSAINNDNIRPSIDIGVNKAVEAFVGGHNLAEITTSRNAIGFPGIDRGAIAHPSVSPIVSGLTGRIDTSGRIQAPSAAPAPAPAATPPNPRIDWFKSAGDYDIANLAARVGGYSSLSTDDLQEIYNSRSGTIKNEAESELRNRGLIP